MSASPGSGSGADLAVIPDEECWVDIAGGRYVGMKPSTRFPIYTRGNAGEVFPEVAYPLTFTTSALWATRAAARSALKTGAVTEAELAEPSALLAFLGGYAYLNLSANRVLAGRAPGGKPSDADLQVLGVSTVPYVRQKGDRSVLASLRLARWALGVIRNPSMQVQVRDEREFRAWRATLPAPSALSDAEIIELLRSMIGRSADLFEHHLEATGMAGVPIALLAKFCDKKLHDPSMLSKLIAGVGNIDSAAPAFALWKLGRTVRGSAALTEQFDRGVDGLHDRLRADDRADAAAFLSGFGGFLDEFGSRGPNEWESACPTWGTDPDMVLSMLDRLRLTSDDNDPAPAAERLVKERGIAYEHVTTRIGRRQRKQLDGLLRAVDVYSQAREKAQSNGVGVIHEARLMQRELGRRCALRGGAGARPDDLWFVTGDELDAYVADPVAFAPRIAERRAMREKLASRVPPFIVDGDLPPFDTWELRGTSMREPARVGAVLTGMPGCPGVARGRARVVLDPTDPGALEPGDVLVAPLTDPSWTPLFLAVEAVVVDVGAVLSHAVIVSRELGIPSVVSVTDATTTIPDGALIEVDGAAGTVRILDVA